MLTSMLISTITAVRKSKKKLLVISEILVLIFSTSVTSDIYRFLKILFIVKGNAGVLVFEFNGI